MEDLTLGEIRKLLRLSEQSICDYINHELNQLRAIGIVPEDVDLDKIVTKSLGYDDELRISDVSIEIKV